MFLKSMQKMFSILKKLSPFLLNQKKALRLKLVYSCIFNILGIISVSCIPIVFKYIIENLSKINSSSFNADMTYFFMFTYLLIWVVSNLSSSLREIFIYPVMEGAISKLSLEMYSKLINTSLMFHLKKKIGEISSIIDTALSFFPTLVIPILFSIIPLVFEVIFSIAVIGYFCGIEFSLLLLVFFMLLLYVSYKGFIKITYIVRKSNLYHIKTHSKILDGIINFFNIRVFGTMKQNIALVSDKLDLREKNIVRRLIRGEKMHISQIFIFFCFFSSTFIISGYRVINHSLSIGDFVMINTYILQLRIPIENIIQVFRNLNTGMVKMEKAINFLNLPPDDNSKGIKIDKDKPITIEFKDVSFSYDGKRDILKKVNLKIKPNDIVVIVGETGSGKSTLLLLLLGLINPTSGIITINGYNIKKLNKNSLLEQIGFVPQNITLFNDTLVNNLRYSSTAVLTNKSINKAISLSLLAKTVNKFADGIYTIVGEQGVRLSGGEKQRVGIARVFCKNPLFFILDEATSSLDIETEKKIIDNIYNQFTNSTKLIITHRKSVLRNNNNIYILKNGTLTKKQ